MSYAIGSLVNTRGRDWVVLPPEEKDWLLLKPLGGSEGEIVSILPALEPVRPSAFVLPNPQETGDARTCALLRDAVRLGFRATGGPFRSFGHISVEPRPYQLVPLLMALKQETVRLLIADDVGIGKTVEAALIVRELLDRGEIRRFTVLCPPHLAEQWQTELIEKFNIEAKTVLPSTVAKLERGLGVGTSLFEAYPFTIVSLDYIKSDRHRAEFLRACPELVVVDEAHACASSDGNRATKQRYELVRKLAETPSRHMIFVTATPHSGKEDVFRSLLGFLKQEFTHLPENLAGGENETHRRALAEYFVQRRRGDIRAYMNEDTPFPVRAAQEITWRVKPDEKNLFENVLALAREGLSLGNTQSPYCQRIYWWSALALLRAVASSPAAAAATLRNRAIGMDIPEDVQQIDALGRQLVFDLSDVDETSIMDTLPGAESSEAQQDRTLRERFRERFNRLARLADELVGEKDSKLQNGIRLIKKLVSEGYSPVVFCRFIHTADYVAKFLQKALPKVRVESVTGMLPPEERENRVLGLSQHDKRILVCTDCLSEGINLQESFNAVVHYDLSWNPTRHEQREGRVDRFGQPFPEIRVITYYGQDNPIDGIVLDVLLRKHETIRKSLGISVPIPEDGDKVMQAILEGVLLRKPETRPTTGMLLLPGLDEHVNPEKKRLAEEWNKVVRREEKRSRTLFAQQTIKVADVARELDAANEAAGNSDTVEQFVLTALPLLGAVHTKKTGYADRASHLFTFDKLAHNTARNLNFPEQIEAVFLLPTGERQVCLSRTHPLVERLAAYIMDTALDPLETSVARRCGTMRTQSVATRTTLLLCRFRFQLRTLGENIDHTSLTEECALLTFSGSPQGAQWQADTFATSLLAAEPAQNILPEQATAFVAHVVEGMPELLPHIRSVMQARAETLLEAHRRVRMAARIQNIHYAVQAQGEPDILGIFVYLPVL